MKKKIIKLLMGVLLLIILPCTIDANKGSLRVYDNTSYSDHTKVPLEALKTANINYNYLLGVKYRYGGTSLETGIDCSRLIQILIGCTERHSEDIYINNKAKHPELVFFKGKGIKHIGWMVNDSTMLHCDSRGVNLLSIYDIRYKFYKNILIK